MQYKLKIMDNLYFVEMSNGLYLLDTGSPYTYSVLGCVDVDGVVHENAGFENALKVSVSFLERRMNATLAGIIGNDILLSNGFTIDKSLGSVQFHPEEPDSSMKGYSVDTYVYKDKEYVILNHLSLSNKPETFAHHYLIDTGTNTSYVSKALCQNESYQEHGIRYYPALHKEIPIDLYLFHFMENDQPMDLFASITTNDYLIWQMKEMKTEGFISPNGLTKSRLILDMKKKMIYLDNSEKKK